MESPKMLAYYLDEAILRECARRGLVVSFDASDGFFTWTIDSRHIPWWEDAWCYFTRWLNELLYKISFGHINLYLPCIGCRVLGELHTGFGQSIKSAYDSYRCSVSCTGDLDCDDCRVLTSKV